MITKLTVLINKKGAKPTTHQIISTKGSILGPFTYPMLIRKIDKIYQHNSYINLFVNTDVVHIVYAAYGNI